MTGIDRGLVGLLGALDVAPLGEPGTEGEGRSRVRHEQSGLRLGPQGRRNAFNYPVTLPVYHRRSTVVTFT